jgi:murein DD-endopeptidase MepM/ murein hydrolase activator NlpD
MAHFGWTRLAYLLFALTVLMALAQLGSPSADPMPQAPEPTDGATTEAPSTTEAKPREPAVQESAAHTAFVDQSEARHQNGASTDAPGPEDTGPPVFYRPALASHEPGGGLGADPVCADLGRFPSKRRIVFPLPKEHLYSYEDTWGALRPQGGHEGTDLMAPTGTPEYAVTDGTIVPVAGASGNGWNSLGGYAVMLEAAYSVGPVKEGDLFYYAHLNRESALETGTRVRAGQVVGYAGDTGQGPEITRGLFPPHLHLGWYDAGGSRSTVASGAMNPYPLLEWIKAGGGAITGGSDVRYCEAPRTGDPTPSTGESYWPASDSPGVSPDLDTGSNAPSPLAENYEHRIDHASGVAPTQPGKPAPNEGPSNVPGRAVPETDPQTTGPPSSEPPKPPAPSDESPRASDGASSQAHIDAPATNADPEGDKTEDHPGEDGVEEKEGEKKDTPKDRGEEPEKEEPEDPLLPGGQISPGEGQYAPETGEPDAGSDTETTAE